MIFKILFLLALFVYLLWAFFPRIRKWWGANTPEGWEDEHGFHYGKKPVDKWAKGNPYRDNDDLFI